MLSQAQKHGCSDYRRNIMFSISVNELHSSLDSEEQFSAVSHYDTFHAHITILRLKSKRHCWKRADHVTYSILLDADQTQTTEGRNRSCHDRLFLRELAVAWRERSPVTWLWRPVLDLQSALGMLFTRVCTPVSVLKSYVWKIVNLCINVCIIVLVWSVEVIRCE